MLRKSKTIIAMLLVVLTFATTITSVHATEGGSEDPAPNNGAIVAENEDTPVKAAITKQLKFPEGTNVPNARFIFEMKGISIDGDTSRGQDAPLPPVSDLTITYPGDYVDINLEDDIWTLTLETLDIFRNVHFTSAGEYVYEITEMEPTNPTIDNGDDEWLNYSKAKYTLHVLVANKSGEEGGLYIYAIGTKVTINDDGTPGSGDKVDATPGGNRVEYYFSQMIFINEYVMLNEPDKPDEPDPVDYSSLFTSKTVEGIFASHTDFFDFEMTVNAPSLLPANLVPAYYKAYVVEGDDVVTSADNVNLSNTAVDANGRYIMVVPGVAIEFSLRHNQRLVFLDTPVGTRYEVKEFGDSRYLASYVVTINGIAGAEVKAENHGDDLSTGIQYTGESGNSVAFTNYRDYITPTGLNVKDLPFFVLIALGLGTLFTFVAMTVNKRRQYHR